MKQGVEDWNTAFEAAGFKNVMEARDYPDDPSFDPDDIRYNCIRYAVTDVANAMGPSYTDPRTGEILVADVIWYHNVISLVHNWAFRSDGRRRSARAQAGLRRRCDARVAALCGRSRGGPHAGTDA